MRMERCQNTQALAAYTHKQGLPDTERQAKRELVINVARDFIHGMPAKVMRWGRDYTREDLLVDVQEHDDFDKAVFAAYANDPKPMRDLVIRCAQYAVCEYLYPCDEEYLGFSR